MFVVVYLNDILIFLEDKKGHVKHIAWVLEQLKKWDIRVAIEKSEFHQERVEFLGYIFTPTGVEMSKEKVKAVMEWL